MAYADQSMSSRKLVAIIGVGVLHALLGYAFITGLAFNVIKKVSSDLKTFDVEEAPPPKEAPPPPPPQKVVQPPPVVSPPPIVQIQQPSYTPPIVSVPVAPVIHEQAAVAPPAPSQAVRATPKGNFQSLMSSDDYPSASLRNNEEGTVGFKLDIGTDGRVTNCTVTSSSGHPLLDETSCRLLSRRARFNVAKDASGTPVPAVYASRFLWKVPKD
jgi:protein TonB